MAPSMLEFCPFINDRHGYDNGLLMKGCVFQGRDMFLTFGGRARVAFKFKGYLCMLSNAVPSSSIYAGVINLFSTLTSPILSTIQGKWFARSNLRL
jgi:hypothetical protein